MKAHLAGLARVLANANEISLGWVFPGVWGFSRLNIVFMLMICCWHFMLISLGKFFIVSAVHNF